MRLGSENGLDALRLLRTISPRPRLIMLTGYGSIATAVAAMRQGADDYLTKPLTADQIFKAARGKLEGERVEGPPQKAPSLDQVEWEHIQRVLQDCDGNVSRAAAKLGVHRRSLQRKLAKRPMPG